MTLKEQLIREIESMPEELLAEVLDFAGFIKAKREKQQTPLEHSAELPSRKLSPILRGSKAEDLLKFAGTWQGDDFEECFQEVYETRSPAQF
ncbi:hypothetical protein VB735_10100 [Halotia wernerae UHCC 0503]|nr:hypothetical protein [Halotia wernerae UHCC 0503]